MCHFESRSLEPTLHVETLIRFRAVQYCLVAAHMLCHVVQCLYDPQAKLFALLVLCDCDILDVSNEA